MAEDTTEASQQEETTTYSEAIGNFPGNLKKQVAEAPFSGRARQQVERAAREFLRELSPEGTATALENTWKGNAVLISPDLNPEEVVEVRKLIGALQNSIIAFNDGRPETLIQRIALPLETRFKERSQRALQAGNESEAEACSQAAKEYQDLQEALLKAARPERASFPPLPQLEPPKEGIFKEYLDNLNRLIAYVQEQYGEVPPLQTLRGMSVAEFGQVLSNQNLPEETLIFFDHNEATPGQPRGWTQSNELTNRGLFKDPNIREQVVRDLMRSANPKNPVLNPDQIEFTKS